MQIEILDPPLAGKKRLRDASTVILHATAGTSIEGAVSALRRRGLSYDYLVGKDGRILKCKPLSQIAHHAGVSFGPDGSHANAYSIGVSLVNLNDGRDPYPPEQIEATKWLVAELAEKLPSLKWIATHRDVSWPRKTDPLGLPVVPLAGRLVRWRGPQLPHSMNDAGK